VSFLSSETEGESEKWREREHCQHPHCTPTPHTYLLFRRVTLRWKWSFSNGRAGHGEIHVCWFSRLNSLFSSAWHLNLRRFRCMESIFLQLPPPYLTTVSSIICRVKTETNLMQVFENTDTFRQVHNTPQGVFTLVKSEFNKYILNPKKRKCFS